MPTVNSGFLIVKSYPAMCREFDKSAAENQFVYGIPRKGIDPHSHSKQYRGMGRDALVAWHQEYQDQPYIRPLTPPLEKAAATKLGELDNSDLASDDFIFSYDDALRVFQLLVQPETWQLLWVTNQSTSDKPPAGASLLGYEPTWFGGDHFSAIMDSMFFPRWHGTDEEGKLFLSFFNQLNPNGLFERAAQAEDFVRFYTSQDWAETGKYVIAEVWLPAIGGLTSGSS